MRSVPLYSKLTDSSDKCQPSYQWNKPKLYSDHRLETHTVRRRLTRRAYDMCGICVVSKRLGTCLVFSYLLVKILTIVNAIMQVYLIQKFLGFTSDGSAGQKSMDLGRTFDPKAGEYDCFGWLVGSASNENLAKMHLIWNAVQTTKLAQ
ncbi:hypothetical protein AHF37_08713 [Paragonimus kellicotti]|nr:hypothetical protein AHF37_08713 [Paragonimus kellicotti]